MGGFEADQTHDAGQDPEDRQGQDGERKQQIGPREPAFLQAGRQGAKDRLQIAAGPAAGTFKGEGVATDAVRQYPHRGGAQGRAPTHAARQIRAFCKTIEHHPRHPGRNPWRRDALPAPDPAQQVRQADRGRGGHVNLGAGFDSPADGVDHGLGQIVDQDALHR